VDCNNQASDGCEVRFGPAPTDLPTIMVSSDAGTDTFHQIAGPHDITVDQDRSDWVEAIPLVRVNRACVGCQVNNSPGGNLGVLVENPNTPPNSRDLEAYFRVTWNADSLFLLALVKDDQPLVTGPDPMITNYNPSPAELQDGVEVLVDGDFVLVNGYRSDTDRHLFIGAASDVYNANLKADERNNPDITISTTQAGSSCYFVEMQIKSPYVRSTSLPPLGAGVRLGFDVAVNDWDAERREADRNVPVRAHQAFWREPGPLYAHDSTSFPKIELFTP
jgi:hypothetical protein